VSAAIASIHEPGIRWLPVDGAEALLTYERDRVVLECFRQFAGVQPAP
jgi:hypothetical protein